MGCKPGISRASSGLLVFVLVAAGPLGAAQRSAAPGHAMGRAPCAWAEPLRGAGNALDVPATIHTLQDNGFDCVAHVIGAGPPNSFEDFKRLLAAAQPAGISVWPVLLPPSEGTSPPFKADYQGWMKAMAHLSLQYPVLRGVNIDDFLDPPNAKTFNRSYMCSLYQAKQEINPQLLFLPTIYELDQAMADQLAGCVDGVWLWWTNLVGNMGTAHAAGKQPVGGCPTLPHIRGRLRGLVGLAPGKSFSRAVAGVAPAGAPRCVVYRLPIRGRGGGLEPSLVTQLVTELIVGCRARLCPRRLCRSGREMWGKIRRARARRRLSKAKVSASRVINLHDNHPILVTRRSASAALFQAKPGPSHQRGRYPNRGDSRSSPVQRGDPHEAPLNAAGVPAINPWTAGDAP